MSLQAISWVIQTDIPDGVAKLVALVLADYAHPITAECHPTLKQLARNCSQSERSIQRKLRVLQDLDVLTIQLGHCTKSGRQRANSYVLHLPGIDRPARGDSFDMSPPEPSPRGDCGSPQNPDEGCHTVTGEGDSPVTGEGDSPVTPIENPEEPTRIKDSPQPPEGGAGSVRKIFRGNGLTAPIASDPGHRRAAGPALDPGATAQFDRLWAAYPEGGRIVADRGAAERYFAGLSAADRDLAVTAATGYAAHLRKAEGRTAAKALHSWLRQRRFTNLAPAATSAVQAAAPTRVFVREDSPEWDAWTAHQRSLGLPMPTPIRYDSERAEGWRFPSAMPPAADLSRGA